jgi:hypothetical protein
MTIACRYPLSRNPNSGACSLITSATSDPSATPIPDSARKPRITSPRRRKMRSIGATSPAARRTDETKFRTNRVPIVGMTEYDAPKYCWMWATPTPRSVAAPR